MFSVLLLESLAPPPCVLSVLLLESLHMDWKMSLSTSMVDLIRPLLEAVLPQTARVRQVPPSSAPYLLLSGLAQAQTFSGESAGQVGGGLGGHARL